MYHFFIATIDKMVYLEVNQLLYHVNIFLLVRAYSQRRSILIVYKPTVMAGSDFISQQYSVITENNRVHKGIFFCSVEKLLE